MKTIALCGLSFLLTICPLQALYFWDLNGSAAGSGSSQPTGSWNADAYWNEDPQGDGDKGGCVFWPPEGYSAVFAAGDDAYDAYTVYINGIVQASAVHVDLGQVTFDPDAVNGGSLLDTNTGGMILSVGHKTPLAVARYNVPISASGIIRTKIARLIFGATNTYTGPTRIEGGSIELGVPYAIPINSDLILANDNGRTDVYDIGLSNNTPSTFHTGGQSQRFATLDLAGPAPLVTRTIDFGDGSSLLTFGDSSGKEWRTPTGEDIILHIINYTPESDVMRFGTTAGGLTSRQLGLIHFDDLGNLSARIDAQGYVTPAFQLSIERVSGGVQLTWNAAVGRPYRVQYKTDLTGPWIEIPEDIVTWSEVGSYTHLSAAPAFYRVRMLP